MLFPSFMFGSSYVKYAITFVMHTLHNVKNYFVGDHSANLEKIMDNSPSIS